VTFVEARNAIIFGLENHLGCPVVLSEQIADVSDFPYSYYSVLASRISDHAFGLRGVVQETPDGYTLKRSEPVKASLSFTFCSENRESPDGYIFGEDEALELAEKAHRYFLLDAHNIITDTGEVVINNVGSVANRSGFLVEDTVRRYGFDVMFSYVRIDEKPTITIQNPGNPIGDAHS